MTAGRVLAALFGQECPCVTIWAAIGTLVISAAFLLFGPPAALHRAARMKLPESPRLWGLYDANLVREFLGRAGKNGWRLYRWQLYLDIPFLVLYGWGLAFVLDGTFVRWFVDPGLIGWVVWLAVAPAAADLVEDLALLRAISGDAKGNATVRPGPWIRLAAVSTVGKWLLVLVTGLLIAIGAGGLAASGPGWVH